MYPCMLMFWYNGDMKRVMPFALCVLAAGCALVSGTDNSTLKLAVRGKQATYTIVIPEAASPSQKYAAEELQRYVKELTGVELRVAADAINCVPPAGGAQLAATATAAIRIELTDEFGTDGFRLTARPPNLLVRGGVRGCLYGVYELLETYGGVGWFASWRTVVPKLERFAVPANLDDEQRPAFKMRMTSWLDATHGDFAARLRLNGARAHLEEKHGGAVCRFGKRMGSCHTFSFLLSPKKYFAEHPDHFDPRQYLTDARAALRDMVRHKIVDVLGCNGKA